MKKSELSKILAGATGAAMLLSGCTGQALPGQAAPDGELARSGGGEEDSRFAMTAARGQSAAFDPVAHVQGSFSFNQEELTPADEAFSLFGTVVTGMCAKPNFAFEENRSNFYVNVGGNIKKSYSVNLKDMKEKEQSKVMLCSCATGPATANVRATGVPVSEILQLAEDAEEVNTVTFVSSDGYGRAMPLSYVLEKEAMIVYQVNDRAVPTGTQLYVPETVAKYFTRDVVDIVLTREAEPPVVEQRDERLRAEVSIMNYADGCEFPVGGQISFEGYADDCGDAIAAVEFSLDGGATWTAYETAGATADRWVYWHFDYTPKEAGTYQLSVRARTESGNVSPLAANLVFAVTAR